MHIKLLNVARSSLQELREDYRDYLLSRMLPLWTREHPRFENKRWHAYGHCWNPTE